MRQIVSVMSMGIVCLLLSVSLGCGPVGMKGVQKGMGVFDVERVMGREPDRKIYGDGIDIDKETHVYRTGRIHYFKKRVVLVEKNKDEPTISEKAGQLKEDERHR
jgi:hypothetical protein